MGAGVLDERAHPDGVKVKDRGRDGAGATHYGRVGRTGGFRVTGLDLPSVDSARGRLIRAHEILHASASEVRPRWRARWDERIANIIEDVRLHTTLWESMRHLDRDAGAVALQDALQVRRAFKDGDVVTDDAWNVSVLMAVRAYAVAFGAARPSARVSISTDAFRRVTRALTDAYGLHVQDAIQLIRYQVSCGEMDEACGALSRLLRTDPVEPEEDDDEDRPYTLMGERSKPGAESAQTPSSPMDIVELPRTRATAPPRTRRGFARSGSRLNVRRAARAVASLSTHGLFLRRNKRAGGAVLIDASGSMRVEPEALAEVCALAPAGVVGYYSGMRSRRDEGVFGTLHVFARGGRRASECPRTGGGNSVDLWALRWLLKQVGPRVFVTDGRFTGGPKGQAQAAFMELKHAEDRGLVTVVETVEQARELFASGSLT